METLKNELKKQIIEELNLEEISPEDIKNDAPLFGEISDNGGLGLDSIDALELVVIMETTHNSFQLLVVANTYVRSSASRFQISTRILQK